MEYVALITSVAFFILLEAFFSGSELVLVSANKAKLHRLAKKDKTVRDFLEDRESYVNITLFGYTFSIVIATAFYTYLWIKLTHTHLKFLQGYEPLLAETLLIFTIVFGEIIPKSVFLSNAEFLLPLIVKALYPLKKFLTPLNFTVRVVKRGIEKIFHKEQKSFSRNELLRMVISGKIPLSPGKRQIIANILSFRDRRISEIVKPLHQVVTVSDSATVEQVAEKIKKSGYSRIPVYATTLQDIIGYVQAYDLLKASKKDNIVKYLKPIKIIGEFEPLKHVMDKFISSGEHIGVVVDERGVVIGIVTLEDIIEEITGELYEKAKQEEEEIKQIGPDRWIVNATIEVTELNRLLNLSIPSGIYTSLGGFIQYHLGRLPKKGEEFTFGGFLFKVVDADSKKVKKVLIRKK
jgi:CBS domain containing-hemolysin-like protein